MLTMAMPKDGKLSQGIRNLLQKAGFVARQRKDSLTLQFDGRVLKEAYLLRTRRVPCLVREGYADFGIAGEDILGERGRDACIQLGPILCESSGLRRTRVALFGTRDDPVSRLEDIPAGSRIVSEYREMTDRLFSSRSDLTIESTPGSAEAEVPLAYRFGVGVVDSGRTLRANRLKEIYTLFVSAPTLITNEKTITNPRKKEAMTELVAALRPFLDWESPGGNGT